MYFHVFLKINKAAVVDQGRTVSLIYFGLESVLTVSELNNYHTFSTVLAVCDVMHVQPPLVRNMRVTLKIGFYKNTADYAAQKRHM